jgi:TonB-linked SusC/RagA family outer membrane protein
MRFNYNYRDKYLLEFNGRYDGASLFPSNRRYHFFPSISAGYNIAKEKFWDPLKGTIGNLKLRASYGNLGDVSSLLDAGNYYLYQATLSARTPSQNNYLFGSGQEAFVQVSSLKSPNVTWAKPSMLDFGIDIGALDERLQFTFDWYRRRTIDLYGPPQQFPAVLGVAPPQENNASIETKGFDLTASWDDHIGKLHYNARFILSNYKGKVLSYPNPVESNTTWYKGQNMGDIWGYETAGLFQSDDAIAKAPSQSKLAANWHPGDVQYRDLDGNNQIDFGDNTVSKPGDKTIIGNNTPRFNYGFTLSADYKGFDFQVFIQGVAKREFWPGTTAFFWGITGSEWSSMVLTTNYNNRWTTETPNGYFPRYYMSSEVGKNYQAQTRYMLKGAYLRVKNLQIGYTLPQALMNKIHVGRLRIYASAENLLTSSPGLNNKFQVDPELLISNQGIYPIQRTFSFGVNLNIK